MSLLLFTLFTNPLFATTEVTLRDELGWAGHGNYVGTAGTFRDTSQGQSAACSFIPDNASSFATLFGIPAGATVAKAHLTWAASGTANDYSVVFNNQAVSAPFDRRYTINVSSANTDFYSGAADVTTQLQNMIGIASGGSYNFSLSGLDILHTGDDYCNAGRAFGGWSLIVIYALDSDPLRLINVFEGFDTFWGGSLELVPKNFQVPATLPGSSVNYGKHGHVTWEGDPQISSTRNGFGENLKFQGVSLSFSPTNPTAAQYNATIADQTLPSSTYVTNSYGVDLDIYDISNQVTPGITSVETIYEAGQDRVFLSSEILSILNVNVADIQVSIGPSSKPITERNTDAKIRINIDNNGPFGSSGSLTTTVPLPTDLSIFGSNSFSSNGWACLLSGSVVFCTKDVNIADGGQEYFEIPVYVSATASDTISLDVSIPGTVDNPYPIVGGEFDNVTSNNSTTFNYAILSGDISTSIKTFIDDNAGIVEAGDSITYQITLVETNGVSVSGISINDPLVSGLTNLNVNTSTLPVGTVDNSTSAAVQLSNINLRANETLVIEYSADILGSVDVNDEIINIATISENGSSFDISATLTIQSLNPIDTVKRLYLYSANQSAPYSSGTSTGPHLSRVAPTSNNGDFNFSRNQNERECLDNNLTENYCGVWTLDPNLVADLNVNSVNVNLELRELGRGNGANSNIYIALIDGSNSIIADGSFSRRLTDSFVTEEFSLTVQRPNGFTTGGDVRLLVQNDDRNNTDRFTVRAYNGANKISQVLIDTDNVINVDSILFYDSAHVCGNASDMGVEQSTIEIDPNAATTDVYVRAIISDPFGTFDITAVNATLTDALSTHVLTQNSLTQLDGSCVSDLLSSQVMVEFTYSLTPSSALGLWQALVTGEEGFEGEIWDTLIANFSVYIPPELIIDKQVALASSPATPISNAKLSDKLQYQFVITNISAGDAVNLVVHENISPYSSLLFGSSDANNDTFVCLDCVREGITFSNPEPVYSQNNDSNFNYTPVPIDDGLGNFVDTNVTNVQIELSGTLAPGKFITFTYQVVVN